MNPSTQIFYHLAAWAHHPVTHARFHIAGISRALPESGIPGFTASILWITGWTAVIISLIP